MLQMLFQLIQLNLENIDSIVHCAALVHQMRKEPKYEEYFSANKATMSGVSGQADPEQMKAFEEMLAIFQRSSLGLQD